MQSNNPMLRARNLPGPIAGVEPMTVNGTVGKTAILLILAAVTAGWTWNRFNGVLAAEDMQAALAAVSPFMWAGLIGGMILAMVTIFAQRWVAITAPLYAIAEGFALGGISAVLEQRFPNIVFQAVALTGGVLAVMLLAYRSGWIKVTDKFRLGVVAATGAIALLYLVDIGLNAFTSMSVPFIHEGGMLGIGFSLLVVGLAALNLVLDFDMIERLAARGAPRQMEWYGAFALMLTLVWLYLEILRLLSKARR